MDHDSEPDIEPAMDLNREPTAESNMDLNKEPLTGPTMGQSNHPTARLQMDLNDDSSAETDIDLNKEVRTEPAIDQSNQPSAEHSMDLDDEPSPEIPMDQSNHTISEPQVGLNGEPSPETPMDQSSQSGTLAGMDIQGEPSTESNMDLNKEPSVEPRTDFNKESTAETAIDQSSQHSTSTGLDPNGESGTEPDMDPNKGPSIAPSVDHNNDLSTSADMDLSGKPSTGPTMDLEKEPGTESGADHNRDPSTLPDMETCNKPITPSDMRVDKDLNSTTEKAPEGLDIEVRLLKSRAAPSTDRRAKLAAAQRQLAQSNAATLASTTQIPETVNHTGVEKTPSTESNGATAETAQDPQTVDIDGMAKTPNMGCNETAPMATMSSQGGEPPVPSADRPLVAGTTQPFCSTGDSSVVPGHVEFPTGDAKFPTAGNDDNELFVPLDDIPMDDIGALQAFTYGQPLEMNEKPNGNQETSPKPASAQMNGEPAAPPGDTAANDDTHCEDPEWPEALLNSVNDQDSSEFEKTKAWFEGLSNPTMEDSFRYEAAKLEDDARQKRLANRKVLEEQPVMDNEGLPPSEHAPDSTSRNQLPSREESVDMEVLDTNHTMSKRKRSNRISESEKRRSIQVGLDVILEQILNKGKTRKRAQNGPSQPGSSKRTRKNKGGTGTALEPFLVSDLFGDARANSLLPEIPKFSAKDKVKAILELVANIPTKDKKEALSDKQKVLKATRKFTKSARSDGKGGWKIKGLKTSLYHHQLLGAGFMRDRENSTHAPFGGLMCDFMGFGKTIQALANIMDGQPCDPNDPLRTTLIIVPSHLVMHWKNQIIKHCDMEAMGRVLVYCAHSRMETLDIIKDIQHFSVVITTYDEIRRSYPLCSKPQDVTEEDTIRKWWTETCEKETGPLHLIKFLRIILDEGHVIKNHVAQTSVAVRALTGKFKWILSGTPVHNHIAEFYPHFHFLGVPQLGDFSNFKKQYCKGNEAHERLVNLLRALMIKRTHRSRLFSLPVIKLPDLDEEVIKVNFCKAERTIYDRIVNWFLNNLNESGLAEDSKLAQSRCILTMILVLRMFCSHILNAQKVVKPLLSVPFMQELKNISNDESTVGGHPSRDIIAWLLAMKKDTGLRPPNQTPSEEPGQLVDKIQGDSTKLIEQFRQLMCELHEQGNWVERLERTSCASCGLQPVNTVITDCMHLYCEECYYLISDTNPGPEGRLCAKCNSNIKEAAQCCFSEDMALDNSSLSQATALICKEQSHKSKRETKRGSKNTTRKGVPSRADRSDGPEDEDEDTDWIVGCNGSMPGAKLSKILEIVRGWIKNNPDVKIVVFTQFLDFVQILTASLRREGCPSVCLTGKMQPAYREESVKKFSEDTSIRVMIASLKAGGIGLDMTAAHKCILVDLWWNEAIQDQAFCRLWRIGQKKPVECIKVIVEDTIDDYLLRIQLKKTARIKRTMDTDVLENRATIRALLEMFGVTVEENDKGAFIVTRNQK